MKLTKNGALTKALSEIAVAAATGLALLYYVAMFPLGQVVFVYQQY